MTPQEASAARTIEPPLNILFPSERASGQGRKALGIAQLNGSTDPVRVERQSSALAIA